MGWRLRISNEHVPFGRVTPDYGSNTEYFTIRMHHSGKFVNLSRRCYIEGDISHIDYCTKDEISKLELGSMIAEIGLSGHVSFYYSIGTRDDCMSLVFVEGDIDAMQLANNVDQDRIVGVFVDHQNLDSQTLSTQTSDEPVRFPEITEPLEFVGDIEGQPNDEVHGRPCKLGDDNHPSVNGGSSHDGHINDNDMPNFNFNIIDDNESSESDGEVSVGNDSEYSDYLVDSECELSDDNDMFDDNIDEEVEWVGLSSMKNNKICSILPLEDLNCPQTSKKSPFLHKGFTVFNPKVDMDNICFKIGMCFVDTNTFRKAVKKHAIDSGRAIKFTKNDRDKVQAKCKQNQCPWLIYASKIPGEDTMQIKTLHNSHECSRQERVIQANSRFLAEKYSDKIRSDPNWPIESMWTIMQKDCKLTFSKHQMYRVKQKVFAMGHGDDAEQYSLLWRYAEEIMSTNPNSTVKIKCKLVANEAKFKRFYICWGALKQGFIEGCRPIICLDGTHLKTTCGGVLLTAVGIDANNCIYPFAYAVVEKEKRKSWLWFIDFLIQDLNIKNSYAWTIMSDKQKGLIDAVEELLPNCEHRFCVMHLYNNFKKDHKGLALKNMLWRAARATRVVDFHRVMEELKGRDLAAFDWLVKRPPAQWSRSHFSTHCKSDILLNNFSESFNALIVRARSLPIIEMLENIRIMMMKRIGVKREQMRKYNGWICSKIQKLLEEQKKKAMDFIPIYNGHEEFEIDGCYGDKFKVHIGKRTCSCRRWELNGIPCAHAIAGMYFMGYKPENYVHDCYSKDTYMNIYSHYMSPMQGKESWPNQCTEKAKLVPPVMQNMPGRPKKQKRKLQPGELEEKKAAAAKKIDKNSGKLGKKGIIMTCKYCGGKGHNIRRCPLKKLNPLAASGLDIPASCNQEANKAKSQNVSPPVETRGTSVDAGNVEFNDTTNDPIVNTQEANVPNMSLGPRTATEVVRRKKKLQVKGKGQATSYTFPPSARSAQKNTKNPTEQKKRKVEEEKGKAKSKVGEEEVPN